MAFTKAFPVGTLGTWGLEAETPELALRKSAGGFHFCVTETPEDGFQNVAYGMMLYDCCNLLYGFLPILTYPNSRS